MAVPKKDSLLARFSRNFNDRITAPDSPYPIPEEWVTQYTAKHVAYLEAYNTLITTRAQGTRSKSQTSRKNQTKDELLFIARTLYTKVKNDGSVSDADKILLGIHLEGPARKIPQPSDAPGVQIDSTSGRTISLSIYDSVVPTRRGKPKSIVAAHLHTFVGPDYPSNPAHWKFAGACTRRKHQIHFPDTVPAGATVWVCATWVTRKQQAGPKSSAISVNLPGGGSVIEASERMAA